MAITKIGLNLSKFNNITVPDINSSVSPTDIIRDIPRIANESTNNLAGWGILGTMFLVVYSAISEKIGLNEMGYDETRTFELTSIITVIFGLLFVMIGFITDFTPVGVLSGLLIIGGILIIYFENKDK